MTLDPEHWLGESYRDWLKPVTWGDTGRYDNYTVVIVNEYGHALDQRWGMDWIRSEKTSRGLRW